MRKSRLPFDNTFVRANRRARIEGFTYIVGVLSAAALPNATAQTWRSEASIGAEATLTNNANYGVGTEREGDLIFNVFPSISFARDGGRVRVAGTASLNMIGYVDGVQTSRILPQANILANIEAVEQHFFIDLSVAANQNIINPFLPQPGFTSTENQFTYWQGRIVPYLQGNIGPNLRWLVRSDNSYTYTTQTGNPLGDSYFGSQSAEMVRTPTPLGYSVRLQADRTRIQDQVQADQTLESAIATVNYAFSPQLTFGLRGGYETTNYTSNEQSGPIYGFDIAWSPSPLTRLTGYWQDRFYGSNYLVDATHRQRQMAFSINASRSVATYPQLLLTIPATGNVSGLLNAILIARFPDPIERERQVQELINRQGLPSALPGGTNIYSQSANVLTNASGTAALIGVRNTLALNIYYLKTDQLADPKIPPTFIAFNNNIQQGATLSLTHNLTPTTTLTSSLGGYETNGFGQTEGLNSKSASAQFQVNWQVTPRNSVFAGSQYQWQRSTNSTVNFGSSSEASVFAGIVYRL